MSVSVRAESRGQNSLNGLSLIHFIARWMERCMGCSNSQGLRERVVHTASATSRHWAAALPDVGLAAAIC